ncbi:DUF378 domain-containing protein [Edaphobacillus lindanitolerans]|uniref:DUF378 domain-containing protein n=1 Tax=Edaphobacillus lindanitolerans TaxID=550447 RepID=A0A1U7PSZ8_9BACI|nr:DUF378 domain-containing protein [Edaphobacillus lindanitolerans]SIT92141.1 hypothetical protein SAMN05428946_2793 [Edaphobacillus lindanitolerans]
MNILKKIALAIAIIGALNWGLVAFIGFDLVADLSGGRDSGLARFLYGIVALAGIISLGYLFPGERDTLGRRETDELSWQYRPAADIDEKNRTAPD